MNAAAGISLSGKIVRSAAFFMVLFGGLIRQKVNHSGDGTATGGAERRIVAHHAVVHRAVDAFRHVTSSLENAYLVAMGGIGRRRDGSFSR